MRITIYAVLLIAIVAGLYSFSAKTKAANSLKSIEAVAAAGNKARIAGRDALANYDEQRRQFERDREFAAALGMTVDELYLQREARRNK